MSQFSIKGNRCSCGLARPMLTPVRNTGGYPWHVIVCTACDVPKGVPNSHMERRIMAAVGGHPGGAS